MITRIKGELEIDHDRGRISFYVDDERYARDIMAGSPFCIRGLKNPIPQLGNGKTLEIKIFSHSECNWH